MYRRWICLLALASLAASSRGAHADSVAKIDDAIEDEILYSCSKASAARVQVTLRPETSVEELVAWAMSFSCKSFLYASSVASRSAKVTLIAPASMTARDAWRAFLVALQSAGLTVVPKGPLLEIVEAAQARNRALPVYHPDRITATDQLMRVVIRPRHAAVDQLAAALAALGSKHGEVTPLPEAGLLLVTDYGTSIDRMLDLLTELDLGSGRDRIYLVPIAHADATAVASKLNEVFAAGPSTAPRPRRARDKNAAATSAPQHGSDVPTRLIAEPHTNALIVVGSETAYHRVRAVLRYIDLPVSGGGGMYVYHLEHADASTLVQTLTQSLSSAESAGSGRRSAAGAVASGTSFEGAVPITADTDNNALVIVASSRDYAGLRQVIAELDRRPAQVFIEAHIIEYQVTAGREVGASAHLGQLGRLGGRNRLAFGSVQPPGAPSSLQPPPSQDAGGVLGVVGASVPGISELLGISIPSFGVLFQALATRGHVEILSAPHLTATDNKQAVISIGDNIAIQTGARDPLSSAAQASGVAVPSVDITRQKVGLTLTITPRVSEDSIRLEVEQEINDIAPGAAGSLTPAWTERRVATTVVVRDQQSVVIGGLMQRRSGRQESKVPLLGDLPVLGALFRRTEATEQKTNLLIILTPHLVRDDEDMRVILERKQRERDELSGAMDTFATLRYEPAVDYRKKRGVLEEINRTVIQMERERALLEELHELPAPAPAGAIDDQPSPALPPARGARAVAPLPGVAARARQGPGSLTALAAPLSTPWGR